MNTEIYKKRLGLFPFSTELKEINGHIRLFIAGCDISMLARQYGTPLYLYDRYTLDESVQTYRQALARCYPAPSQITYAAKAYLCLAIAQWAQQNDLLIDCTGQGEIHVAVSAGVSRENILVHGVNKTQADLKMAVRSAGVIVVDNLAELRRLAVLYQPAVDFPDVWLRLRPGLPVETHVYTQTGQPDSKFGMDFSEAQQAVEFSLQAGVPLKGLHFHQGSHFHDPAPVGIGVHAALEFAHQMFTKLGWLPEVICPGGGWGVAYHEDDLPQPNIEEYIQHIADQMVAGCTRYQLPLPHLHVEPGRSLVARAGVSLYQVGTVKFTPQRRWLLLDGGMADNPRPALYRARYSAMPVIDPQRPISSSAWIAGPYCESGDILIQELPIPDVGVGEVIAIPASGAYHLSMGSNYNGACKPAVLWLSHGNASLIQERETQNDLIRRDHNLP